MSNMFNIFSQIDIEPGDLDIPKTGTPNETTITEVLQIVFGIAGGVAMLIIIIAGIQFMLSRGDPEKAATARRAIIYAGVGLVLAVTAFSIVSFVVTSV